MTFTKIEEISGACAALAEGNRAWVRWPSGTIDELRGIAIQGGISLCVPAKVGGNWCKYTNDCTLLTAVGTEDLAQSAEAEERIELFLNGNEERSA